MWDDWGIIWLGSEVNCFTLCVVVRESACVSCKVAMSLDHHSGDLALRLPKMILPRIGDLGALYTTATYPLLFCFVTSETSFSAKDVMFTKRTA